MTVTVKRIGVVLILAVCVLFVFVPPRTVLAGDSIGVLMTGDIKYYQDIHVSFMESISSWADMDVIVQKPAPEAMAWANSARKLVTIGSKVIIVYGAPATLSVMKATSRVPIIFAGVYNPEAMKIMGKNATGISSTVSLEDVIEYLTKISNLKRLGVIFNKGEKDSILQVKETKKLEKKFGFKLVLIDTKKKGFTDKIGDVDAVLITSSANAMQGIDKIIAAARNYKVPTASIVGGGEEEGVIITVCANPKEQGQVLADLLMQILGGKNPKSMALKQPENIDICLNLNEAKNLGITVPGDMIDSATRVIK